MSIHHNEESLTEGLYGNRNINHVSGDITDSPGVVGHTQYRYFDTYGEETPNFTKRKKKGELIPHRLFVQTEVDFTSSLTKSVSYTGWDPGRTEVINAWTSTYWGDPCMSYISFTVDPIVRTRIDGYLDQAGVYVQAAAAKLSTASFDALTFAAEVGKLRSQFTQLVHRAKLLIRKFRLRRLASAWLEYRYAWRTLWYDILAFDEALRALDLKRGDIVGERAGSDYSFTYTDRSTSSGYFYSSVEVVEEFSVSVGVRGSVTAKLAAALPKYGANPGITAWETLKFSFIIDWFVTVGNYLESLRLDNVSEAYTASHGSLVTIEWSRFYENLVAREHPPGAPNTDISIGAFEEFSSATQVETRRTPTFIPKTPLWNLNLDPYKIIDLISLIFR